MSLCCPVCTVAVESVLVPSVMAQHENQLDRRRAAAYLHMRGLLHSFSRRGPPPPKSSLRGCTTTSSRLGPCFPFLSCWTLRPQRPERERHGIEIHRARVLDGTRRSSSSACIRVMASVPPLVRSTSTQFTACQASEPADVSETSNGQGHAPPPGGREGVRRYSTHRVWYHSQGRQAS